MNKTEAILENIVRTLSGGALSRTGDARVDYYTATAVRKAATALRELRLARIFDDPGRKADLTGTIARLNALLAAIEESNIAKHSPSVAEAVSTIERAAAELGEGVGEPASKMAAG